MKCTIHNQCGMRRVGILKKNRFSRTNKSFKLFAKVLRVSPAIVTSLLVLTLMVGLLPTLEVATIAKIGSEMLALNFNLVFRLLLVLILCKFVILLINRLISVCREKIILKVSKELELELINKTLRIELRDKEQITYNDKYARAFSAVNPNQLLSLLMTLPDFVANIVTAISLSILLFSINYIIPIIVIGLFLVSIKEKISSVEKYYSFLNQETTELRRTNKLISYITNKNTLTELRMYRAYDWMLSNWKKSYDNWAKKHINTITVNSVKMQTLSAIMERYVFPLVCLVLCICKSVDVTNTIICLQGVEQLSAALNMIVNNVSFVSINGEICENYFGLLEHKEREIQEDINSDGVAIECKGISFAYDEAGNVLNNISVSINRNEIVALVGYNGSGKTTLSKILLGVYKPSEGTVEYDWAGKVDGQSNLPKRSVLYQDFCIYKDMNIYENVAISAIGKSDETKTEELIGSIGLSSSTLLGNEFGGIELSSGQAQKVALARCLNSPSGLALLDEPLSYLDPYAEYNLIKKFTATFNKSTRIFTTHRLSCTKLADRILVMDKGTIVEDGNHESLMKQKGKYYELFSAQAELYQ